MSRKIQPSYIQIQDAQAVVTYTLLQCFVFLSFMFFFLSEYKIYQGQLPYLCRQIKFNIFYFINRHMEMSAFSGCFLMHLLSHSSYFDKHNVKLFKHQLSKFGIFAKQLRNTYEHTYRNKYKCKRLLYINTYHNWEHDWQPIQIHIYNNL